MSIVEPSSIDLVIYHANCSDGMGAAWSAWQLLGDRADYYAASHGDPPPDVKGRRVAILDFSYSNPVIKQMIKDAEAFVIIDHHKSAMVELHDIGIADDGDVIEGQTGAAVIELDLAVLIETGLLQLLLDDVIGDAG